MNRIGKDGDNGTTDQCFSLTFGIAVDRMPDLAFTSTVNAHVLLSVISRS